MIRVLLLTALIAAGVLLAAPFALSSWSIDQRGVEITGRVFSKSESVWVRRSTWERACQVTVSYETPDQPAGYLVADVDPATFDRLHKGGTATLRYLRKEDLPRVPFAESLRNMHLLPTVKFVGKAGLSSDVVRALKQVAGGALLLIAWRLFRCPGFPWAVAAGVTLLLAGILNSEFPRPLPAPQLNVRKASGRVASLGRIAYLFGSNRSRGMEASQPIQVVGVEFVPAEASDPVLAVDLIDEGSIAGLKVGAPATVVYETASPRSARMEGGTRQFASRNLNGTIVGLVLGAALLVGMLLVIVLAGRGASWAFRRITQRS